MIMSDKPIKSTFVIDGDYYKALSEYQAKELEQANKRVAELEKVIKEADEYLEENAYTSICSGSILHRKFKEALEQE